MACAHGCSGCSAAGPHVLVGVADACIIDQYADAVEDLGRRGDRESRSLHQ